MTAPRLSEVALIGMADELDRLKSENKELRFKNGLLNGAVTNLTRQVQELRASIAGTSAEQDTRAGTGGVSSTHSSR